MKIIIAIDPGASGGIAVHSENTTAQKMPETPGDTLEILAEVKRKADLTGSGLVAYMEEVSGYAGEAQPGSSMFKFGRGFGQIEGMLYAMKIPFELVRPQKWQKALGLGTRGPMSKTEWKNKLKERAKRQNPEIKVTLDTADALLILEYGMKAEFGQFTTVTARPLETGMLL